MVRADIEAPKLMNFGLSPMRIRVSKYKTNMVTPDAAQRDIGED